MNMILSIYFFSLRGKTHIETEIFITILSQQASTLIRTLKSKWRKKADDKMYVCKFERNLSSKLYQTENSKTTGQTA